MSPCPKWIVKPKVPHVENANYPKLYQSYRINEHETLTYAHWRIYQAISGTFQSVSVYPYLPGPRVTHFKRASPLNSDSQLVTAVEFHPAGIDGQICDLCSNAKWSSYVSICFVEVFGRCLATLFLWRLPTTCWRGTRLTLLWISNRSHKFNVNISWINIVY